MASVIYPIQSPIFLYDSFVDMPDHDPAVDVEIIGSILISHISEHLLHPGVSSRKRMILDEIILLRISRRNPKDGLAGG